jgi:clan AA aspartic protease
VRAAFGRLHDNWNGKPDREPIVRIILRDVNGQEHECDAVVNTGFTGWLTLPPDLISVLSLSWKELGGAILADGSTVFFDVYDGIIVWDGQPLAIPIDESDTEPLVGMTLMYGYELNVQNVDGGTVTLRRM